MKIATASLVLLVIVSSAVAVFGGTSPKAKLRIVTPRFVLAPVSGQVRHEILAIAQVEHPNTEEFWCPIEEWEWGDGSKTTHERDCRPFSKGAETDEAAFTARYSEDNIYRSTGVMVVTFRLKDSRGHTLVQASEKFSILRGGEMPDEKTPTIEDPDL